MSQEMAGGPRPLSQHEAEHPGPPAVALRHSPAERHGRGGARDPVRERGAGADGGPWMTGPALGPARPERHRRSALEGAARPADPLLEPSGAAFNRHLEATFRSRLPLAERLAVRCCLRYAE